jgi:hypothetical protein
VTIGDRAGWSHFFAHMQKLAPGLKVGQKIEAGKLIGYVGNTGSSSNGVIHLHYSLYPGNNYQKGVDPHPYLYKVEKNVCSIPGLGNGKPPAPGYNNFLTDAQLEDHDAMTADQIRAFLAEHKSFLRKEIKDVDGQAFDAATVIAEAAGKYRINPMVILTTLQKECGGVTQPRRPSDDRLRILMGCRKPSTARQQLTCAAERFRTYHDQLTKNGETQSGWRVGKAKRTEDGVNVTPAAKAVAGQFTYTPYAGTKWGGNQPKVGGGVPVLRTVETLRL